MTPCLYFATNTKEEQMPRYYIQGTIERVHTITSGAEVEAKDREEAEKLVREKPHMENLKIIKMVQKPEYKSERWRQLEDVIFEYGELVEDVKNDPDESIEDYAYREDKADFEKILQCLIDEKFREAYNLYSRLDTSPRERFPVDIWNTFKLLGFFD